MLDCWRPKRPADAIQARLRIGWNAPQAHAVPAIRYDANLGVKGEGTEGLGEKLQRAVERGSRVAAETLGMANGRPWRTWQEQDDVVSDRLPPR